MLAHHRTSNLPIMLTLWLVAACGNSGSTSSNSASQGSDKSNGAAGASATTSEQVPPEGASAIEAWLKQGMYKNWHCESSAHDARSPSPHGVNRICSNDAISENVSKTSDWPKGAAAVKEFYAAKGDKDPVGYAVYAKTAADSASGANWYWYERVPLDSMVPHDSAGVVADGMGDSGPAQTICVACHAAAGSDAAHTPSAHGRDQVYTPVQ